MVENQIQNTSKREAFWQKLRGDFFYGLILVLPIAATLWLVRLVVDIFSGPLSAILPREIPYGLSFVLTIVIITLLGMATRNIVGKYIVKQIQLVFGKIPVIRTIYKSVNQIVNAFSPKSKTNFKPVLVEFPRKGTWALAFVTNENVGGLLDDNGRDLGAGKVAVFVPSTPNPTTGFCVYVEKSELVELNISSEDCLKVLMSVGALSFHKEHTI